MSFSDQLSELLPVDLPHRETVIAKAARHLDLIVEANQHFNLTRILDEREAAIKHVVDSVTPWRLFADAPEVFDVGTGAGFPGIPLAVALPEIRFTLVESTGKKARFVAAAAVDLDLANVDVMPRRAEEVLRTHQGVLITARAVAPLDRALDLLGPAVRVGSRALLYKGPDGEAEIDKATAALRRHGVKAHLRQRYDLPDELGSRTMVELAKR
ncbi:MAG TPA: 16S rRNA (guanine(527)-N(7))-methyltransferase RsmG [Bryobacteraceae bacterium]|nr:16S rRNA (guanine(527)-N(7))-methyltransferase RsmG [Bryobacteraceae bacterium]